MNRTKAQAIAQRYVKQLSADFELMEEQTLERDFGWVFFYNRRAYIELKNPMQMLVGNAPILVDKVTGEVHETGTAHSIEHYIEMYEKYGTCHR